MYIPKEGHEVLVLVNVVLLQTCPLLARGWHQGLEHNLLEAQATDRHMLLNNMNLQSCCRVSLIYLDKLTEVQWHVIKILRDQQY